MLLLPGIVLVLASVWVSVDGSCWVSPIKNFTTRYGSRIFYCEYTSHAEIVDNQTEMVRFNVTIGSSFDTLECEHCQCRRDGLHCCGTGFYAGTFQVPKACEVVPDGCQPIIVLATDHTLSCFTKRRVRSNQYGMGSSPYYQYPSGIQRVFRTSTRRNVPVQTKLHSAPGMFANRLNSNFPEDNLIENSINVTPRVWPVPSPMTSSRSETVGIPSASDSKAKSSSSSTVRVSSGSPMMWPSPEDSKSTFSRSITMRRSNEVFPPAKEVVAESPGKPIPSDMALNRMLAMKLLGLA